MWFPDDSVSLFMFPQCHSLQTPRDFYFLNSQLLSASGYFSQKDRGVVGHHKAFQTAVFSLRSQGRKADFSWDLTGLLDA